MIQSTLVCQYCRHLLRSHWALMREMLQAIYFYNVGSDFAFFSDKHVVFLKATRLTLLGNASMAIPVSDWPKYFSVSIKMSSNISLNGSHRSRVYIPHAHPGYIMEPQPAWKEPSAKITGSVKTVRFSLKQTSTVNKGKRSKAFCGNLGTIHATIAVKPVPFWLGIVPVQGMIWFDCSDTREA